MADRNDRGRRGFSLLYLGVLSGILLTILIINGLLEIGRAKNGFFLLLEQEGTALIQHFEKNLQETFAYLQSLETAPAGSLVASSPSGFLYGLEEVIAETLLEAAHRVDQIDGERPLSPADLKSLGDQIPVTGIDIFDAEGRLLRATAGGPPAPRRKAVLHEIIGNRRPVFTDLFERSLSARREDAWSTIAVRRKAAPGIIALHLNDEQLKRLLRQFAIQRAISDIGLREGIVFVSVEDASFRIVGHTDPTIIGKTDDTPFLRDALRAGRTRSRLYASKKEGELFEVAKSFSFNRDPAGLIRIGFSPGEIQRILGQIRKNVALSILFFLILGVSAIALIWVNQNRHLKRVREMEDRIQRTGKLASLGHLAAGVAHEIRNPLNAIGMGIQRLKREFLPPEEEQKAEYLSFIEVILGEIRRVNGIIEQFLSLARPFKVELHPASLQEVLTPLALLFREEAASRGVRLSMSVVPDLPRLDLDPDRLTQALVNVMKNGIQAMENGGTLSLETRLLRDGVDILVTDTGPGIPPDQLERIFDYYFTTKEKGVGLGLPLAHRIIEAHGGRLRVESPAEGGTRVTITLPLRPVSGKP